VGIIEGLRRIEGLRKISRLRHRANKIRHLVHYFKNWPELVVAVWKADAIKRVVLRNGIQIEAPEHHPLFQMTHQIFFTNAYTPKGFSMNATDVVVDIGANIGIFSLYSGCTTSEAIHAFEPFPNNCAFLKKNIESNNLKNVILHNCAVSNKIGKDKLYISERSDGHLLFDHCIKGSLSDYVEVSTTTLEQVIDECELSEIGFLKIDCEGAEGQIILSTPRRYLAKIRVMAIEFHDNVSIINHDEIGCLLTEMGFLCKIRWNGTSPFGYIYALRS
jgi:FkbM family methyltransferase